MRPIHRVLFIVLIITLPFFAGAQIIGGIGAQLFIDSTDGYTLPRIQGLVPNTPASTTLKVTEYILKVDDVSCKNKPIDEVIGMIRGPEGTTVKITASHDKEGKFAQDYTLKRVSMQTNPSADPRQMFNDFVVSEMNQIKSAGFTIVKDFTSDCGNFFFNFEAEKQTYRVRVLAMEFKTNAPYNPGYTVTASVFDNDHDNEKTQVPKIETKEIGNIAVSRLDGPVIFKNTCIGVVNTQINGDLGKCPAMHIIVYR